MTQVKTSTKVAASVSALNAISVPQISKEEKFIELAQKRVGRAIIAIQAVGKLAVRRTAYTNEQTDKIMSALQGELDTVYGDFTQKGVGKKAAFTL